MSRRLKKAPRPSAAACRLRDAAFKPIAKQTACHRRHDGRILKLSPSGKLRRSEPIGEKTAALVDLGRLLDKAGDQFRAVLLPQLARTREERRFVFCPAGAQKLVDFHQQILRHVDELGGARKILRQHRAVRRTRDLGLLPQCGRRDPKVLKLDLAGKKRFEVDVVEPLAAPSLDQVGALFRQRIVGDA